jgi:hypothetical protein
LGTFGVLRRRDDSSGDASAIAALRGAGEEGRNNEGVGGGVQILEGERRRGGGHVVAKKAKEEAKEGGEGGVEAVAAIGAADAARGGEATL